MVYFDPPYGVRFGSNFQPFVRNNKVGHGKDNEMTREPEMVKAYRDTWELGLHSYLTYIRDRLFVFRELLHESGSIFVQISDENLHHVREVLDEVFGASNFRAVITFKKTAGLGTEGLASVADYLLWYARDISRLKERPLYQRQDFSEDPNYVWVMNDKGEKRRLTAEEAGSGVIGSGWRLFRHQIFLAAGRTESCVYDLPLNGATYKPTAGRSWSTNAAGAQRLIEQNRLTKNGNTVNYVRFADDFGFQPLNNFWPDGASGVGMQKSYVVQTNTKIVQRCMLMTTDPGDLVFDPTCGSGTTAYVSEQWGRRWITVDTSRVPLALARQRLLTATFPYYELKDQKLGPAGGFVYKRKQNRKGEEVGGLVPHITLRCLANDEQPATEVLVDRPEEHKDVVRVAGPFVVEATIAAAQSLGAFAGDSAAGDVQAAPSGNEKTPTHGGDAATHIERMTQVLRQSKTLHLPGNRELVLEQIRRTSDGDILHAEASDAEGKRIAIVFGPESGAISADMVFNAAREAHFLRYDQLYFFAFAIQAKARELIEDRNKDGAPKLRIQCAYVAVTPDVAMSDLLKTTRASEIFSVTGLPDVTLSKHQQKNNAGETLYQVEVRGLEIFNPANMEQESVEGENLPCWMLDTDYDPSGSFYATQVFFPKTGAWDNLQKSLKASFDESVWGHLAGTTSEPFVLGDRRRVAVKVIDERGNELMRVIENIA
ncbi:site-specific DNA-methyltransferase [Caballeronia sp. INML1]|uniref:site-specific DNA-methyltransferase n=1 Tax=Caballeronia sp. INML1 TaxID=2921760 RepID=UPI00253F6A41